MDAELLQQNSILLEPEFATDWDCRCLMDAYDFHAHRVSKLDYSKNRVVHYGDLVPEAAFLVRRVSLQILEAVGHAFPQVRPLFVECLFLSMMPPGSLHPHHADNTERKADGSWGPNHTPQRDLSAILYLNKGFVGGDLLFPTQNIGIHPQPGLLVAFPSGATHEHSVSEVESGVRYCMPIWFTTQPEKALQGFPGL